MNRFLIQCGGKLNCRIGDYGLVSALDGLSNVNRNQIGTVVAFRMKLLKLQINDMENMCTLFVICVASLRNQTQNTFA